MVFNKKGDISDYIVYFIIGMGILVVGVVVYILASGKGVNLINQIKGLLSFGR